MREGSISIGKASQAIAQELGIGATAVSTAKRIKEEHPLLHEKIKCGEMTLQDARRETNREVFAGIYYIIYTILSRKSLRLDILLPIVKIEHGCDAEGNSNATLK